ncbi:MAG TPA: hypothetical protein VFA33_25910 [Bryobacteraceae bacterium]|nr:hypothetical protein [Bryobacteraceae bacterium]
MRKLPATFVCFCAGAWAAGMAPALEWVKTLGGSGASMVIGAAVDAGGNLYIAGHTTSIDFPSAVHVSAAASPGSDVFAVKLDADGNVVYATRFGGSGDDTASAMAVGQDGSVYVAGATMSADLPVTPVAYLKTKPGPPGAAASFLLKLNPDGSLGWSTYFTDFRSSVESIAVDAAGNVYAGGTSAGSLPTTPGAYQPQFQQSEICTGFIGCIPGPTSAFVSEFNAQGSGLVYSTYVPMDGSKNLVQAAQALLVDSQGRAWFGGQGNVVEMSADGSALLTSAAQPGIAISALAMDSDGNVYATGTAQLSYNTGSPKSIFPATPGAFQSAPQPPAPVLPLQMPPGGLGDAFVIKWDAGLSKILAATLLGGELGDAGESIHIDPAGYVLVSGQTDSRAFPTRAPFQTSFSARSGFVAGLSADLTQLLFSTYLGDERPFDARAAVPDGKGNVLLAGATLGAGSLFIGGDPGQAFVTGGLVAANKIALPPAPPVRLDSVLHFASRMAAPLAPGEPVMAAGSGFRPDAQLLVDGAPLAGVTGTSGSLVAEMPEDAKTSGSYVIQVASGGQLSNPVFVPAAATSPGIYSTDGTGYGQGYILNSDGTLNSPEHPAAPGSAITIFAAGVGQYTRDHGYAVTALAPSVFVDGFYANGIAAVSGPVAGFPGNVYQLGVYVPDPATLADKNPNLLNFKFPPQVGVRLVMGPVNSSNPDNSAMISQGGLVLNVK